MSLEPPTSVEQHDSHLFPLPSLQALAVLKLNLDLLLFWQITTKEKDDNFSKLFGALYRRGK